ncbi:flagellin [Falsirhodobacter sp. 20TX0035]|uniref:flagellin n=1 Tax=Falsirhodobacter sp. 20TX0035 TaxID=3022019 RepID=UPI00233068A4|nr:flagellin [Falsirhodobacter sp. 20TX0035]MDB6453945.1 flagellin [Falsirhodobacter sp. 20TX0035]
MASITLADMAQNFALRRHNTSLQSDLQRLSQETVTGLAADTGRAVGGDFTELSAITGSLSRLEAYGTAVTLAATLTAGTQGALAAIDNAIGGLGTEMSNPTMTGTASSVDTLGKTALHAFQATVSALNTGVSGQSLFGGTEVNRPALADAETILSALQNATATAGTAEELEAAVNDWFASDFTMVAYKGGAERAPYTVGENDRVQASVTATDPALVQTLKGLAMGALLSRGALAGQTEERQDLAQRAGGAILKGGDERTDLMARIGAGEARLSNIQTRNTAQIAALELARTDILSVDNYESAVRLEATQTQIETLYSVTARLSQMSLADFL